MDRQLTPFLLNALSANITKWSNTLKQFVGKLPTNCLSVYDHFVGLALKGLKLSAEKMVLIFFAIWLNDETILAFLGADQLQEATDVASPNIPRTTTDLESSINDVSPDSIA